MSTSGLPSPDHAPPQAVRDLAGTCSIRPIWLNEVGGITFLVEDRHQPRYIKWSPTAAGIDLGPEETRLRWLAGYPVKVPSVIAAGRHPDGTWLLTTALPGENAVTDRWKADPATAVRVIGESLRAFHDELPVDDCPFDWGVDARLTEVRARTATRPPAAPLRRTDFAHLTHADALAILADPPPIDALVVCHGDTCAPNTVIDDDGRFSGHVDLGSLGVADRWADLAIATWSTTWNYGPGWEAPLLDAYGITDDAERTLYYRLLWDLGP